jgi:hypothetical protein
MFSKIKKYMGKEYRDQRIAFNTMMVMLFNMSWGIVKFILGAIKQTYFFCVSGVYSFLVGVCKLIYIIGAKKGYDDEQEKKLFKWVSIAIIISNIVYIVYMGKLFFFPEKAADYGLVPSIAIAAISFGELIVAIVRIKMEIKKQDIMNVGLRCLNLTSAFSAIVFTQVCLIEAMGKTSIEEASKVNAFSGTMFGLASIVVAIIMLVKISKYNKKEESNE